MSSKSDKNINSFFSKYLYINNLLFINECEF